MFVLLRKKKWRNMMDEISELRIRVREAEAREKKMEWCIDKYEKKNDALHERTELQQRIIDGLNNGTIKKRKPRFDDYDGYSKQDDHNPYPKE